MMITQVSKSAIETRLNQLTAIDFWGERASESLGFELLPYQHAPYRLKSRHLSGSHRPTVHRRPLLFVATCLIIFPALAAI